MRFVALLAWLACAPAWAAAPLQLASLRDGQAALATLDAHGVVARAPLPTDLRTPLGSLWKLFVHAYEVDTARAEKPYVCGGHDREEAYCCERGGRIGRDRALVQSCGLYFSPPRLGIDDGAWRAYWKARNAPAWLLDLAALGPSTEAPVAELLQALDTLPERDRVQHLLLDVVLEARDPEVATQLGAQWRVKTWSWHEAEPRHVRSDVSANRADNRIGGFAGWLVDGTVVWARGAGTSQQVLARHARALATFPVGPPMPRDTLAGDECVDLRLFARYPVASVTPVASTGPGRAAKAQDTHAPAPVRPGKLRGTYTVAFANGNTATLQSAGEVTLDAQHRLFARLPREEYVARVLDREAAPEPRDAARALAVAIRSYLQQNARRGAACLAIDDSSATQRVAPRPASAAARDVAGFTDGLVLADATVRYHRDTAARDTLAWTRAVAQAQGGTNWRALLQTTWPRARLSRWDHPQSACRPLPAAREWLLARLAGWRPRLDREPGYAETRDFETCVLAGGRPHVERAQRRLHVRALAGPQDRLDLVHEYLHLAFDAHPNGQDEAYVEALARHLLLE